MIYIVIQWALVLLPGYILKLILAAIKKEKAGRAVFLEGAVFSLAIFWIVNIFLAIMGKGDFSWQIFSLSLIVKIAALDIPAALIVVAAIFIRSRNR